MIELRKDPITKRWVIVSSERSKRPMEFKKSREVPDNNFCPFDYGNEFSTPPEVLAFREPSSPPNSPGWWLRVVPNKFPALSPDNSLKKQGLGIYDQISGYGYHEVIIETPEHNASWAKISENQIREIIWAYIKRFQDIRKDNNIKYIQIFKNKGKEAGASLSHPHSQLIATPIVPITIRSEIEGSKAYYDFRERCVYCDIINQELKDKTRIVLKTDDFIVMEPYASRFPYETWILPTKHSHDFGSLETKPTLVEELSKTLSCIAEKFERRIGDPPFNLFIHTSPFIEGLDAYYHWHIEIIPRLTNIAGFEWGTGFYINHISPEQACIDLTEEKDKLYANFKNEGWR